MDNMDSQQEFFNKTAHDQMNNSHAKQMYTIGKEQRFQNYTTSVCSTAYYDLPTTNSNRGAGFGYGQKFQFTPLATQKSFPGPSKYKMVSKFDDASYKQKGYSFSVGREKLKFGQTRLQQNPGPGTYYEEDSHKHYKSLYSLGKKTSYQDWIKCAKTISPGPGTYEEINQIDKRGNYNNSKNPGSKAAIFSPPTSKRFGEINKRNKIPGPGTHEIESLNLSGKYWNYKMRNTPGGQFGLDVRGSSFVPFKKTPGPGAYKMISEFGDVENPPLRGKKNTKRNKSAGGTFVPETVQRYVYDVKQQYDFKN